MTISIANLVDESVVDGPGIRFVIFTQGCVHRCWDCHNPSTHDPYAGTDVPIDDILTRIDSSALITGVTFSGGDPILQLTPMIHLAEKIKARNLHTILYTGYKWEDIVSKSIYLPLLKNLDMIIDGPYMYRLKTLEIPFIGSTNQRIIDVQSSLASNEIRLVNL